MSEQFETGGNSTAVVHTGFSKPLALYAGPISYTNDLPGPDQVLSNYLGNVRVLRCPSDNGQWFENTGCSYSWNSLLNGQDAEHLNVMGMSFQSHQIPVLFDKEMFHAARGAAKAQNFLYADGHIKNLLAIEGTTVGYK